MTQEQLTRERYDVLERRMDGIERRMDAQDRKIREVVEYVRSIDKRVAYLEGLHEADTILRRTAQE